MRRLTKKEIHAGMTVLAHLIVHDHLIVSWRDSKGVHVDSPYGIGFNGPFIQITVNNLEPKRSRRHV